MSSFVADGINLLQDYGRQVAQNIGLRNNYVPILFEYAKTRNQYE